MNTCEAFLKIKNGNIVNTITESEEEVNVLFETVNKALKELYAAEEAKKTLRPLNRLKMFLKERWKNPSMIRGVSISKKNNEYRRLKEIEEAAISTICKIEPNLKNKMKEILDDEPGWYASNSNDGNNKVYDDGINAPYLMLNFEKFKNNILNGFVFKNPNQKIIRKFLLLHEYGHLFEIFKYYILTGDIKIINTLAASIEDVEDSEGKANTFAIDNMYRKERRELLKQAETKLRDFEESEKKLRPENLKREMIINLNDAYRSGTLKNSEKLDKTLRSIEKERNNLKEENKIFNY